MKDLHVFQTRLLEFLLFMDFERNNAVKLGRETCDIPQHLEQVNDFVGEIKYAYASCAPIIPSVFLFLVDT